MTYDVAIIGGGPGGYTAADEAARAGMSVVLFEKDKLGGTCLNRGCIPTKALLRETELWAHVAANAQTDNDAPAQDGGTPATPLLSAEALAQLTAKRDAVVDTLRSGVAKLMKSRKVEVVEGAAQLVESRVVVCNGERYEASNVIIAVGSVPARIPIEGIDLPGVYTSDDLLEGEAPQLDSLVIIGAGVIGMEMALVYRQMGVSVVVLEALDRALATLDREISQRVALHAKKRGITLELSARVESISGTPGAMQVHYQNKKGESCEVFAAGVLVATGRRANTAGLFADGLPIELDRGAVVADEYGMTSLENVYVIGDARAGNVQLAHVAEAQARNVVAHIAGQLAPIDETLIPSCVYLSPEVASVGMSEDEAKEAGIEIVCAKSLTGANGKALIEGSESGYVKLVCNAADKRLLGAQLVCPRATDMVSELTLAISMGATADDIAHAIHPHPTVSEMVADAARELRRD